MIKTAKEKENSKKVYSAIGIGAGLFVANMIPFVGPAATLVALGVVGKKIYDTPKEKRSFSTLVAAGVGLVGAFTGFDLVSAAALGYSYFNASKDMDATSGLSLSEKRAKLNSGASTEDMIADMKKKYMTNRK